MSAVAKRTVRARVAGTPLSSAHGTGFDPALVVSPSRCHWRADRWLDVAAAFRLVAVVQPDTHEVDRLGEQLRVDRGCGRVQGSVFEAYQLWARSAHG
jgi:hypothetical protein